MVRCFSTPPQLNYFPPAIKVSSFDASLPENCDLMSTSATRRGSRLQLTSVGVTPNAVTPATLHSDPLPSPSGVGGGLRCLGSNLSRKGARAWPGVGRLEVTSEQQGMVPVSVLGRGYPRVGVSSL